MLDEFSRSRLLLGSAAMDRLSRAKVAVFGLGGVGGHAADALVRTGIGAFVLIDADRVSLTNLNRQLIADHAAIGRLKTEVMREHMLLVNPNVRVEEQPVFFLPDTPADFLCGCDYIVDAIDTVSAKLRLAQLGQELSIPVISAMGAGNKLDPTRFEVADIYDTSVCPLCRVMRRELKKRGVPRLKVVYSREEPAKREDVPGAAEDSAKRETPGSLAFVPSVAGLILASEVVRDLTRGLLPSDA